MNSIPDIEFQSREAIKSFQQERLNVLLHYLSKHSPFYQRHFDQHQISVSRITSVDDLVLIPPTTKDDLQQYNWDFLCVPRNQIVEYTSTSGTLGKPVMIALTENDVQRLAYNEFISFAGAGGTADDIYQLMLTLDRQFMAGIAYYEGIRKLGAGLIRVGPGLPALQWETIQRIQPTVLVAVPSFLLKLIEFAQQHGIDLNTSSVTSAVCIGENIRTQNFELNTIGKKIKDVWNIHLFSTYASTEMQTAFTECSDGKGGHHHPELVIVELLNDHNYPVAPGEPGEVTITTLGVEGMPLLRYKTGDIAKAHNEICACGRTTLRLGPVIGRKQHMIKLKGTTLYPSGIFEILQQVEGVHDFVAEAFTGVLDTDELRIHVYCGDHDVMDVEKNLRSAFQSRLRVVPEIKIITLPELELMQKGKADRKAKRFVDNRKIN
ncbi:MAG: AMP-binding protein [Cyclobacteriaceae bacterium]|nr:AMP-binding protein [Cyclobacteriaceae bacterium]